MTVTRADVARFAVTERSAELVAAGVPHVRATVVRAEHPTSVHAGDAAVVHADGTIEGFVGGTCAESSVQVHARAALVSGEPLLLRILPGGARGSGSDPAGEDPVEAMTTEHGAVTVSNPCLSGGAVEIFLEPLAPPARLVVAGDTPIARALVDLAGPLGFDAEATTGAVEVDADVAAVVVASHGRGEDQALTAALDAGVPYVALVASRRRGSAVLDGLDVDDEARSRVSVPAGLDIGARTAPEIALSILAELVASRRAPRADVAEGVAPDATPPPPGTAVDPVCGMTVLITDDTISATVDGVTAWFCRAGCRDSWVAASSV
jgi:xanthine dehydrogenase accessory factor